MEFDPALCARYVETLLTNDEVERAELVLDNVPAFFRDNPPEILIRLRQDILRARYTANTYADSPKDAGVDRATAISRFRMLLRGRILEAEVKGYNAAGKTPHLVEMGPGTYFVPHALAELGYDFTYCDIALNNTAQELAAGITRTKRPPEGAPVIFVAQEIIEHLPDTKEIAIEALKHCGKGPHRVHLSTPLYTFDNQHDDWRVRDGLPHLRAYTPQEFMLEAMRLFPAYHWQLLYDRIMSLRGQTMTEPAEPLTLQG